LKSILLIFLEEKSMKKLITICAIVGIVLTASSMAAATNVSLYVDSLSVNSTSASSVVYSWFPAVVSEASTNNWNFGNIIPGMTTMPIDDEILDVTSSPDTGTGNVLVWLFDIATDIRDATNFRVRELVTHTFIDGGTESVYNAIDGSNITATGITSAVWQSVGVTNASLADGHVNQGYYWWWDKTADVYWWSHETATSFYVEYSIDSGTTWSVPASLTVNVIPEPATICLLGLGALGLLRKRKTV
jgi:hypothetical protein